MTIADELFKVAERLESQSNVLKTAELNEALQRLADSAGLAGKAWSGSWLGYHSRVYYEDLAEPPPGARFSQEWGMMDTFANRNTVGNWKEYRFDDVVSAIRQNAGNPDIQEQKEKSSTAKEVFEESQSQVISLLFGIFSTRKDDKFLQDISEKVKKMKVFGVSDFVEVMRPKGNVICRDMPAIQAGLHTPPHISVIAQVHSIKYPFTACQELSKLSRRAASHIQNVEKHKVQAKRIGTNVFIGHGQSSVWKDLKDFIQDRMHLPWDEFNRVPVAGFTNIARLSQMLDEAAIAFLIMTAEDEQADGKQHARQNVIHEAGLFQGRLGFERAILLLEDGCEEFSNIQGLVQIRFPKGNVSAVFENIRRVLEREGLVDEK
jgi:predicted nucleotide-binding protein